MVRRLPSKGCERASLEWVPCRPIDDGDRLVCAMEIGGGHRYQSPGAVIERGKNCGQKLGIEIRNRSPVREGKASEGKGIGLRQMIGRGRAGRGDVLGKGYVTSERADGSWTQFLLALWSTKQRIKLRPLLCRIPNRVQSVAESARKGGRQTAVMACAHWDCHA